MASGYMKTVLTPSVLRAEKHYYGRTYRSFEENEEVDPLGVEEISFLQARDSFYLATVIEGGWPYLQHRGGPTGFLKHLGGNRIAFADYGGNRQMVSVGSIAANDRVSLFLMDYPNRDRLKLIGHATVFDSREHPELAEEVAPEEGHGGRVERIFVIEVKSYDWNCAKFITPRYTVEEMKFVTDPLHARIRELEAALEKAK